MIFKQVLGIMCAPIEQQKHFSLVNSEGFLAEVFHPWVRWEGPGSGFENSSGGAGAGAGGGGVWKSRIGPPWDCSKIWIFSNPIFLRVFEKLEPAFFKTSFFCGFLKNGGRPFFKNLKFSKYHLPAIQKMLILS